MKKYLNLIILSVAELLVLLNFAMFAAPAITNTVTVGTFSSTTNYSFYQCFGQVLNQDFANKGLAITILVLVIVAALVGAFLIAANFVNNKTVKLVAKFATIAAAVLVLVIVILAFCFAAPVEYFNLAVGMIFVGIFDIITCAALVVSTLKNFGILKF